MSACGAAGALFISLVGVANIATGPEFDSMLVEVAEAGMREVARRVRNKNPDVSHYPDWLLYHLSVINPALVYGKRFYEGEDDYSWARVRFNVMRRDGFSCQYCGRRPIDGVRLTVDHIHPKSKGGTNDPENLLTACTDCNGAKADGELNEDEKESLGLEDGQRK